MRYFLRTGQTVIMQQSPARGARRVETGDVLAFDDAYDDERQWAAQAAGDHHYAECDAQGNLLGAATGPATETITVDGAAPGGQATDDPGDDLPADSTNSEE